MRSADRGHVLRVDSAARATPRRRPRPALPGARPPASSPTATCDSVIASTFQTATDQLAPWSSAMARESRPRIRAASLPTVSCRAAWLRCASTSAASANPPAPLCSSARRDSIPVFDDLASDIAAGVAFLRTRPEIDPQRIGLAGVSQAGLDRADRRREVASGVHGAPGRSDGVGRHRGLLQPHRRDTDRRRSKKATVSCRRSPDFTDSIRSRCSRRCRCRGYGCSAARIAAFRRRRRWRSSTS